MFFIILLTISAFAVAVSAAFFSVYGLAATFSGTFWGVVMMGASLEAGKLMTASYLYRYWNKTHVALRATLMAITFAVMLLTSGGIFGFLSVGYQADVLPLKQKSDQVKLLDDERTRSLDRKKQIDDLMAKNSVSVTAVQAADGSIDKNAAKVLHETTRSRESMNKQYREEQKQVTERITEIDNQILPLKQDLLKTEAHVGPIIYIAKAFNLDSDNATKYLIYLIIFAFDPMAISLTLAVNVAIRVRKEEKEAERLAKEQVGIFNTSDDDNWPDIDETIIPAEEDKLNKESEIDNCGWSDEYYVHPPEPTPPIMEEYNKASIDQDVAKTAFDTVFSDVLPLTKEERIAALFEPHSTTPVVPQTAFSPIHIAEPTPSDGTIQIQPHNAQDFTPPLNDVESFPFNELIDPVVIYPSTETLPIIPETVNDTVENSLDFVPHNVEPEVSPIPETIEEPTVVEPEVSAIEETIEEPVIEPVAPKINLSDFTHVVTTAALEPEIAVPVTREAPPMGWSTGNIESGKINELVSHYQYLKNKRSSNEQLSREELKELREIANVLTKHGFSMYL